MRGLDRCIGAKLISWRALVLLTTCFLCACASSNTGQRSKIKFRRGGGFTITEQVRFSSSVRGDFKQALRLIEDEEYEIGIQLLEKVTQAAPHATTAHIDLGIAYRLMGDYESAESSIKRALELNSRHPVAHNELGIVYRKMGRLEEARESYEDALAISSGFHFARRNLAILCDLYIGDMACALEHYKRYAKMVPGDEKVVMWITDLRNRMGK